MRILITGYGGQVGTKAADLLHLCHEVHGISRKKLENPKIAYSVADIIDTKAINSVFDAFKPKAVIHAAAMTGVDACEKEREKAYQINALATKNIAEQCTAVGAKMIYLSTDYVFDGTKGNYSENDVPNPVQHYGFTKLKGEEFVKEHCTNYAICRTSAVYSNTGNNFALWLYGNLKSKNQARVFTDQIVSYTLAENLAEMLQLILEKGLTGTYHTAGSEAMSRFNFAVIFAKMLGFNKRLIKKTTSIEQKQIAKRPPNSSLNISKITSEGIKALNVKESIEKLKAKL